MMNARDAKVLCDAVDTFLSLTGHADSDTARNQLWLLMELAFVAGGRSSLAEIRASMDTRDALRKAAVK